MSNDIPFPSSPNELTLDQLQVVDVNKIQVSNY